MSDNTGVTLEVVEIETGEVVETVPCRNTRSAERVLRGMLINMDRDRFCVRETKD